MPYKTLFITMMLSITLVVACVPITANRGNFVRQEKIDSVVPLVTTQADVVRLLGPPTTVAPFDKNTWYYMGERTETMGMFETEVKERRIVALRFDESGVLETLEDLDVNKAQEIDFVDRKTPTAGKEFTVIQQLVGNIGRFNPAQGQSVQTGSGGNN